MGKLKKIEKLDDIIKTDKIVKFGFLIVVIPYLLGEMMKDQQKTLLKIIYEHKN